jgi:hypothetical protein
MNSFEDVVFFRLRVLMEKYTKQTEAQAHAHAKNPTIGQSFFF